MSKLFHECENHIKDDHLLLRLLVFLCSEDDIDVMINNAPVHIVALHVARLWLNIDKVKQVTCYKHKIADEYIIIICFRMTYIHMY